MKILLVTVPKEGSCVEGASPTYLLHDFANYPPLGLLAIAAEVDPRHELKVIDAVGKNYSLDRVVEEVKKFNPDLLGITLHSNRLYPSHMLTKRVREEMPHIKLIGGGPHIDEFGMITMELGFLDYAMAGYCEKTFPEFVESLDEINNGADPKPLFEKIPGLYYRQGEKIHFNPESDKPANLDEFPFPKRELVDLEDYFTAADKETMTTMYTSRGCPYKCTFCDVLEKKYHYRSAKSTVDEMEYIMSLGIKEIHIFDDTFNLNRKRVIELCNEILSRNLKVRWAARVRAHPLDEEMLKLMKKAGCSRLHAGIESLDPASLEAMKKQITLDHIRAFFKLCKKLKIQTLSYMILGFPEETPEYRKTFFKTLKSIGPTYVYINLLYPLPKTPLYYGLLESGFYEKDHWLEYFKNPTPNFDLPICRDRELHLELIQLMDSVHKRFYLSPSFIIKDLMRNTSPKLLFIKAKLALKLIFADSAKDAAFTQFKSSISSRETA